MVSFHTNHSLDHPLNNWAVYPGTGQTHGRMREMVLTSSINDY